MIKRNIIETIYEYDKEGQLLRKTVTETHEEEENAISTTSYPWTYLNGVSVDCKTSACDGASYATNTTATCSSCNSCGKCN